MTRTTTTPRAKTYSENQMVAVLTRNQVLSAETGRLTSEGVDLQRRLEVARAQLQRVEAARAELLEELFEMREALSHFREAVGVLYEGAKRRQMTLEQRAGRRWRAGAGALKRGTRESLDSPGGQDTWDQSLTPVDEARADR